MADTSPLAISDPRLTGTGISPLRKNCEGKVSEIKLMLLACR